jgi:hypothetical protein
MRQFTSFKSTYRCRTAPETIHIIQEYLQVQNSSREKFGKFSLPESERNTISFYRLNVLVS